MVPGEEKAWDILSGLDPDEVCRRAKATYERASGTYTLKSFGIALSVVLENRQITGKGTASDALLSRLGYFSKLSIPWYMTGAKDVPLSGNLISPVNLKGGQLFFRGTHVLPLERLALQYGRDLHKFLQKAEELDGELLTYGDASVRLFPFPRVPVVIVLWKEDDEFPARADLLFDSSCEAHLALDILWSTAMMSILMLL